MLTHLLDLSTISNETVSGQTMDKRAMLKSFSAVADSNSCVLILGSMPGTESLRRGEYYGHPRNAFWRIMATLTGVPADAPYPDRLDGLLAKRIALWDVLATCKRQGSLDSNIVNDSIQVQPFGLFYQQHPAIRTVLFNGRRAEAEYLKRVVPTLSGTPHRLRTLPSTSPAHAALTYQRKLAVWQEEFSHWNRVCRG